MDVIFLNYYEIGQRIRKYRKAHGMSQEQLAEKVGISVTHMSHIETANTKLSLSVFVDIARALEVQTDDLLSDNKGGKQIAEEEIIDVLNRASASQVRIIADIVKATKNALDKHS